MMNSLVNMKAKNITDAMRKNCDSGQIFKTLKLISASLVSLGLIAGCDLSGKSSGAIDQDPDPVVVDLPIAFIERPLPLDEDGELVIDEFLSPIAFKPGAKIILKERASTSAAEHNITDRAFLPDEPDEVMDEEVEMEEEEEMSAMDAPLYDVKDLEVSVDGMKLLFAMRAPEIENADEDEQPTWNIWEYDREFDTLRRIISSDIIAEQGQDISPSYLPDGRIVFASTRGRRTRAILLDENKPQYANGVEADRDEPAFNLHIISEDGEDIDQITFNPSHDLEPVVIEDGRILFTRWDNFDNRPDRLSFYTINQDGTNVSLLYGYNSQNTGSNNTEAIFDDALQLEDNRVLVNLRTRESDRFGGDIVAIDVDNFIDNNLGTYNNAGDEGPAQQSVSPEEVLIDDGISTIGYYNSAYPLFDGTNRLLVSWSQCLLVDTEETTVPCTEANLREDSIETDSAYGLWIYNLDDGTQLPIKLPYENVNYTSGVVMAPRTRPPQQASNLDDELVNEGVGVLHIRNLYDVDGTDVTVEGLETFADPALTDESEREARFLRIAKPVLMPDEDTLDFDRSAFGPANVMRDLIGYVPIEPDGSAKFKVPANIPFTFSLVNAEGKRVGGTGVHQNWLTLQAGEVRECTGCHSNNNDAPHGREDAQAPTAYPGAVGSIPFPNTKLVDDLGIEHLPPDLGETMAEYYARVNNDARSPSVDMMFEDEWTDTDSGLAPMTEISLDYNRITVGSQDVEIGGCTPRISGNESWVPPTQCATGGWTPLCRITINYLDHIQPLWTTARNTCVPEVDEVGAPVLDVDGNQQYVESSRTCTACHSPRVLDPDTGVEIDRVPAGNFSLTSEQAVANDYVGNNNNVVNYTTSYAQLSFNRNTKALDENGNLGILLLEIDSGEPILDENGDPMLDEDGNVITRIDLVPVPITRPTRSGSAMNSTAFFSLFEAGGSHEGYLLPSELKLIAEWLDVGGQYYNNPFDAPLDD